MANFIKMDFHPSVNMDQVVRFYIESNECIGMDGSRALPTNWWIRFITSAPTEYLVWTFHSAEECESAYSRLKYHLKDEGQWRII